MRLIDADNIMIQLDRKKSGPANQRFTEGFNDATMRFRSMLHGAPTIDPVHAAGGVYCRECKYQEDCDCWVTHSYRDHILEQTIYRHRKLEWCSYGEKESDNEKL